MEYEKKMHSCLANIPALEQKGKIEKNQQIGYIQIGFGILALH